MKHYPFLAITILTFLSAQGQGLTTGEVYDFEVGDVFQSTRTVRWGPPTTTTETIVGKTFYPIGDSVNYSVHRTTYTPPSGPGLPPTFSDQVISMTYFSLDQPAWQGEIQFDTLYLTPGMCGRAVWEINTSDSLGPDYGYSRFIDGCGGPYSHSYSDQTNQWQNEDLTYFNKAGVECGTFRSDPVGISETVEQQVRLSIHPVPSFDQITLQLAGLDALHYGEVDLSITDAQGRACKHMIVHASQIAGLQLNIHDLPAGIFLLNLTGNGRVLSRSRLVKI